MVQEQSLSWRGLLLVVLAKENQHQANFFCGGKMVVVPNLYSVGEGQVGEERGQGQIVLEEERHH